MTGLVSRLALLLAPLLVTVGCAVGSDAGDRPDQPQLGPGPGLVETRCADLVVLGARGSTQSFDRNRGVGTEVLMTVENLADRLHERSGTTVRLQAVPYDTSLAPSVDAYLANVERGAERTRSIVRDTARTCPDSRFALVGFSQGAQVVRSFAADPTVPDRVVLVAMIADPSRDGDASIRSWSYAGGPARGDGRLGAGPAVAGELREAAISLCVETDEICNDQGAPGGPASQTHRKFYERPSSARSTAHQLELVLRRTLD